MTHTLPLILTALLLTACASTPTIYGPAGSGERAIGYSDYQIENDRWRISFTAGSDLSRAEAERLAIRRAAEITLANGYDWFIIANRESFADGNQDSPVRTGVSVGGAVGSGGFRSSGVGVGISLGGGQERRTEVVIEIVAGSGEPPAGAQVYDAAVILGQY